MRKSEYYGVNIPELGDRADITVVSQAIIDSENNQSGKVENMKATVGGTIINLTSETRQDALLKYYNGLAVQFISPIDASAGSSYKIKIGSLTEQPYNNKVDIKVGDIVQAIYGSTGFISANTPIPRSSAVCSASEITVATSKAVKQAYDEALQKQNKTDSRLQTESKEIVGAINESLWSIGYKTLSTVNDFNELTQSGVFYGRAEVDTLNAPFTPPFSFILINYNRGGLIEQTVITGVDDIVVRRQLGTRWRNWEKTLRTNTKEFLGNAGISSIIYIQDSGTKTQGQGYIDKSTGQVYLCLETNTDTSVTSNFVLATNIEIAKRQHFTKTILFDKPTGHVSGSITLSNNWENYDEFIVYGSGDNVDYVGAYRFKKEDIEYAISKGQRYMIYGGANDYWIVRITTGSKTWVSSDKWENCAIFRIIGIKYGG